MNTRTRKQTHAMGWMLALAGWMLLTATTTRAAIIYVDAEGGASGNTVNPDTDSTTGRTGLPRLTTIRITYGGLAAALGAWRKAMPSKPGRTLKMRR